MCFNMLPTIHHKLWDMWIYRDPVSSTLALGSQRILGLHLHVGASHDVCVGP